MVRAALGGLGLAFASAACGRKGDLVPPPKPAAEGEAGAGVAGEGAGG